MASGGTAVAMSSSSSSTRLVAGLGASAMVGAAVWWYVYGGGVSPSTRTISKAELVKALKQLMYRFYPVYKDTFDMRTAIDAKNTGLPQEQLKFQLKTQSGILARLAEFQEEEMVKLKLTEEEVELAQQEYAEDAEVSMIVKGFNDLLEDALEGRMPVLPWITKTSFSETEMLETIKEMHKYELQNITVAMLSNGGHVPGMEALTRVIVEASNRAEAQLCEKRPPMRIEEFYSEIAIWMRQSSTFAAERTRLQELHRDNTIKLFRPASPGMGPAEGGGLGPL